MHARAARVALWVAVKVNALTWYGCSVACRVGRQNSERYGQSDAQEKPGNGYHR